VTGDPEPGPVSRRRRAKPLVVLAVFLTEAALMTANALWWQFSGPWFLTGVLLGNIVVASLLTNWITIL
jgi:hypothetical protein